MTQTLDLVILSTGLDALRELRDALAADGRTRLLAGGDDIEQLHEEIKRLRPHVAVVTLGAQVEAALKFVAKLSAEMPHVAVICASRDASPDLILRSLRAGAREFLRLPLIKDEFRTVLDRICEQSSVREEAPRKQGRTVAVFSSKGGCGTSFIATNLAASMGAPTVLVDLNLQAGDLTLFLGVEPKYSIADFVENRERVDDAMLKSYLTPHSANLSLLAAPREADAADDIEAEHVFSIIQILRERYEYVIIDPQHTFDSITLAALDQVDEVLLVITLDIPAIRSAQRALAIFDRLGYARHKVRIVVNRWSKQIDLDLRQVERYLGERVMGFVTSDYRTAVNSINLGQPLVESEPASRIAGEIRQIAASLIGSGTHSAPLAPEAERARRGLISGLFRRHAKAQAKSAHALLDETAVAGQPSSAS
ncbi:MAG: pilus assembly protein CpaE [Acidobacteriota bacterium]|jgi:pilus assembly protein CpaE|nr:pilus assembly protein CpaE [Acidobacteriota bacterium]